MKTTIWTKTTWTVAVTAVAVGALVGMGGTGFVRAQDRSAKTTKSEEADRAKPEAKSELLSDGEASEKIERTEAEWRKLLTREEFRVLRKKGTEKPFRNKYDHFFEPGTYACAACGQQLFSSQTKFNSGCGWPAFYASMAGDRVILSPDFSMGMVRTEVTCARCDSHLGHIFNDAPGTPTGQRYCINSVSLKFIPADAGDRSEKSSKSSDEDSPTDETGSKPAKKPTASKSVSKAERSSSGR